MNGEPSLRDELLAVVPSLRAFATSLAHDPHRADDLVQDTIMRAWRAIDRFEPGTNLNAWLFTILRNQSHSRYCKKKWEVGDPEGSYAAKLKVVPGQQAHLDYEECFREAAA
jgi:RNA polymerase sigma-70 factor (ECF subfamily)